MKRLEKLITRACSNNPYSPNNTNKMRLTERASAEALDDRPGLGNGAFNLRNVDDYMSKWTGI
jgi:hypothetical protein